MALVEVMPIAMGITPSVAGLAVRTIGPPLPVSVGSGGTTMLLVTAMELTSVTSSIACAPPAASVQVATTVTRLNCATRASCGTGGGVAKLASPYQTATVCVAVSVESPASMRAQSSQSVASPSQGSTALNTMGLIVP